MYEIYSPIIALFSLPQNNHFWHMIPSERFTMIQEMLKQNPEDSFLHYAVALEFKKHGDLKKAIEMLEELSEKQPDYLATYYQLGKMQEENAQPEKAINTYKKGIDLAKTQNDRKALGELNEALMLLEE